MKFTHEKQLNILLDFSGKNNPKEFSVNTFIREIRPDSVEKHYQHLNQELMKKLGTSVEGIALYCWRNQKEIFQTAYAAKKTDIQYQLDLDMNDVYEYVLDVFVERSWIGFEREYAAYDKLEKLLRADTKLSMDYKFDTKYGVDLRILGAQNDKDLAAIQVKPSSYKYLPDTHHNKAADKRKNDDYTKRFGIKVDYLYYDSDTKQWQNWKQILETIRIRHQEYDSKNQ